MARIHHHPHRATPTRTHAPRLAPPHRGRRDPHRTPRPAYPPRKPHNINPTEPLVELLHRSEDATRHPDWWAFVAARDDAWAKAAYQAARARGQQHNRALRGLGARWVRILWRCWTDHTTYDPTLRAVRARGHFPSENAALKCIYLAVMSLDPTGTGRKRWTTRWKRALQAFDGRLTNNRI